MCDRADPLVAQPPVEWAIRELEQALRARRVLATIRVASAPPDAAVPPVPEAFGLIPYELDGEPAILACGTDARGLTYAVLELADRVAHAPDPLAALRIDAPVVERPANAVRSVARLFTSERNDKPWFHDEGFWRTYLSMLAGQRFNRFNLTVGFGYNFPWRITDGYLYFAYPFLVDPPGYGVRVPQLPAEERVRNLEMLKFISAETVTRGLDFQLGLWTHAYEWWDSPDAQHTVEGLTPETHAAYCRDALQMLLEECPAIGGLTIRTHGESGIRERSWSFWKTVLDGAVRSGRRVGIDLHAKGVDQETLDVALATGLPITVSPKHSAEHLGLPYHQAAIREQDQPRERPATHRERYVAVSEGTRPFTRYGYGDFLREDRGYDMVFRIWPGTQRLLLWGDAALAAGFGRQASLAGSKGLEWCEPLSFKGREGTGVPGSRTGYADESLVPSDDWEKYDYTYRLMGRLTYNPDAKPETWRRFLRTRFGSAAASAEGALAHASRILPLVTTAHHPSASNNYYWPEIYTDMPIVRRDTMPHADLYYDSPDPKRFGTATPLDPEVFCSVAEFVREARAGRSSGRYTPLDVARWLDDLCGHAADHLARMEADLADPTTPDTRRLTVDVGILVAIGRFYAAKLRAAVHYELGMTREALAAAQVARSAWADAADRARGVYVADLTFGPQSHLRGNWSDRLALIDLDLAALAEVVRSTPDESKRTDLTLVRPPPPHAAHRESAGFRRGEPIELVIEADADRVTAVQLRYRQMDQSKRYVAVEMVGKGSTFTATIPGDYTDSPFPIQYFFVLRGAGGAAWLCPGLDADLANQPYFVLTSTRRS